LSSAIIYSINFLNLIVPKEALKEYVYNMFIHISSVLLVFGLLGQPLTPLLLLITVLVADAKFFMEVITYLLDNENSS